MAFGPSKNEPFAEASYEPINSLFFIDPFLCRIGMLCAGYCEGCNRHVVRELDEVP